MEITFTSILVRVSAMYMIALVLVRLSGKQSIGELSTMDFVVITLLGDPFDTVIFSDVTLAEGVVAFSTITLLHLLVTFVSSRSETFYRLVSSPPRMLIQQGRVQGDMLAMERMRPETLASDLRLKGEDQLVEVQDAWLESNGKVSVLKNNPSKPARKQDLKLLQ
ncbi:MAG TPA: YetF domain-containing protein [Anaerolineales bacterium]|nr:YetF domain-containing protein [Anaerolineales bacterium]